MKRQIVLENDQLIEMVNESAKRVLRNLMTEGWFYDTKGQLADRYGSKYNSYGTVSPEVDNALKTLANSEHGRDILNAFDDHASEGFMKLCVDHPEIITTLATNPTLAYNLTRDNNFVQNLCNNEAMAQQFGTDANAVAAQSGYGTEVTGGMGFVQQGAGGGAAADVKYAGQDMNGNPIFTNAQGQIVQGIMQYGQDQNGNPIFVDGTGNIVNIDTGQGQQGQQGQGEEVPWYQQILGGTAIGNMFGIQNPNQPQYSDDMAAMYLQNAMNVDQQITDLQAQIGQMEKTDPNNPMLAGLKQNMQMLNMQKNMYQPYLQGYYNNLNQQYKDLVTKMGTGGGLSPQDMERFTNVSNTLMSINGSEVYGKYMAPTQGAQGTQGTQGMLGGVLGKVGNTMASLIGGLNNQQQQGGQTNQTTQQQQSTQATQGGQGAQRQAQPRQNVNNTYNRNNRNQAAAQGGAPKPAPKPAQPVQPVQPVQPAPQPEQPTTVVNPTPQPPQNRVMNPQPTQPAQPAPQPQQQPGQPTVVTHGANANPPANANANAAQTLKNPNSAALNNTLGNKVAGTQFNYNPQQFKGVTIPQNLQRNPYAQR